MSGLSRVAWIVPQLARRRFRDWQLTVEPGDDGNRPLLVIHYPDVDSYTGKPCWFKVVSRIGPYSTPDADRFHRDVTKVLKDAWDHEFDEANQIDGAPIADPHADPQRWRCVCGCLGPKRGNTPHWTCTKCGKEHAAP